MASLLQVILEQTKVRMEQRRRTRPMSELRRMELDAPPTRSLYDALSSRSASVIAEHKRCSPSAGNMNAENVRNSYDVYSDTPWISAISVLTDKDNFAGDLGDLSVAREKCGDKPILRKDFIYDEYQVLEARAFGSDAILLMAALHTKDPSRLRGLFDLAHDLGMDALVELGMDDQPPRELAKIVPDSARIWGINSRNFGFSRTALVALKHVMPLVTRRDITTDLERHCELRSLIPSGKIAVAESGIKNANDLRETFDVGYRVALIGTAFLKGPRKIEDTVKELGKAFDTAEVSESVRTSRPRHVPVG